MKKTVLLALSAALLLCAFLGACDTAEPAESVQESATVSETGNISEQQSAEESSADIGQLTYRAPKASPSGPDMENLKGITITGSTFTSQKGKCAIVGTCDPGVTIKADTKYGSSEAVSYYGYYAISVDCPEASVIVTLTEMYNGEKIGKSLAQECKPKKQTSDAIWATLVGGNSQMFLERAANEFRGATVLSDSEINSFKGRIANRVKQAQDIGDGCELIYIIVPCAMTAYPEDAPEGYSAGSKTRYTQLLDAIREAGAVAIDLRDTFREARDEEMPVYYRTDSHWTEYGAYLAYVELFNYIAKEFPEAAPRGFDQFDWTASEYWGGDMVVYLEMDQKEVLEHGWLRKPNFEIPSSIKVMKRYKTNATLAYSGFTDMTINGTTIKTNNKNLPDMVICRDSYSAQLMDIVAERCNTSYWPGMWSYAWNVADMKSKKPDYVVYITSEWNANSLMN